MVAAAVAEVVLAGVAAPVVAVVAPQVGLLEVARPVGRRLAVERPAVLGVVLLELVRTVDAPALPEAEDPLAQKLRVNPIRSDLIVQSTQPFPAGPARLPCRWPVPPLSRR